MTGGRDVELWVEARQGLPAVNPVMSLLLAALRAQGHRTRVVVTEERVVRADHRSADLVLLKTTTSMGLSAAAAASAAGTAMLNDAEATTAVADKALAVARLAAAGLPVPMTFLLPAAEPESAPSAMPPSDPPPSDPPPSGRWISKPVNGTHGRGVRVHVSVADAVRPTPDEPPATSLPGREQLLQRRVGVGSDVKVYGVGDELFAGRKPFSVNSFTQDEVQPVDLTPIEREAVVTAGRVVGLRIFGVDLRRDGDAFSIVDVNAFPGFRGFPAAVPSLSAEVARTLRATAVGVRG